uniref:Uncharacterized protein n=1 Tax=Anopheles darlingi TaxID=43151 RepID=A0A2M4DAQ8_ANODA
MNTAHQCPHMIIAPVVVVIHAFAMRLMMRDCKWPFSAQAIFAGNRDKSETAATTATEQYRTCAKRVAFQPNVPYVPLLGGHSFTADLRVVFNSLADGLTALGSPESTCGKIGFGCRTKTGQQSDRIVKLDQLNGAEGDRSNGGLIMCSCWIFVLVYSVFDKTTIWSMQDAEV